MGSEGERGGGGEVPRLSSHRAENAEQPPLACSSFVSSVKFTPNQIAPPSIPAHIPSGGLPIFTPLASSALPNILFLLPPYCRITHSQHGKWLDCPASRARFLTPAMLT